MTTEEFQVWNAAVDNLAKRMRPTRLGSVTAQTFMQAVEAMFKANGWDINVYISVGEKAYRNRIEV